MSVSNMHIADDEALPGECVICKQTGGHDEYINAIPVYVGDNIDKIGTREMAVHISTSLKFDKGIDISSERVETHIREHMSDRKVVMHGILHDLRKLLQTTLQHSVVTHDESGACTIDHKACGLYLDTVKQVVSLYRNAGRGPESHGPST